MTDITGKIENPFSETGRWYRGSMHSHSTASDGLLTVPQLAAWYEKRGYDFLCITDHDMVTELNQEHSTSILLIPGAEIGLCWDEALFGEICAVGIENIKRKHVCPQMVIDEVLAQGGFAFISHPHMSGVYSALIMQLEKLSGIEIYNSHCFGTGRRAFSLTQWDDLLTVGKRVWGIASDDRHWTEQHNSANFTYKEAWVMVRAPELTRKAILDALHSGMFYSSTGPHIRDILITHKEVVVKTSPVKCVTFASLPWCGTRVEAKDGETLTEVRVPVEAIGTPDRAAKLIEKGMADGWLSKLKQANFYLRVECWDGKTGYAWSNPFFLG